MGKQWKQCQTLVFWAPKSLQMVTAAMKLKDAYSLQQNWEGGTEISHILPAPTHVQLPPLSTIPSRVVYMLYLRSLYWCIIITQSLSFTFRFTLGAVHSMGLDKHIITYIHDIHYHTEHFHDLKSLLLAYSFLSLTLILANIFSKIVLLAYNCFTMSC